MGRSSLQALHITSRWMCRLIVRTAPQVRDCQSAWSTTSSTGILLGRRTYVLRTSMPIARPERHQPVSWCQSIFLAQEPFPATHRHHWWKQTIWLHLLFSGWFFVLALPWCWKPPTKANQRATRYKRHHIRHIRTVASFRHGKWVFVDHPQLVVTPPTDQHLTRTWNCYCWNYVHHALSQRQENHDSHLGKEFKSNVVWSNISCPEIGNWPICEEL